MKEAEEVMLRRKSFNKIPLLSAGYSCLIRRLSEAGASDIRETRMLCAGKPALLTAWAFGWLESGCFRIDICNR